MYMPKDKRPGIWRNGVLQIWVTRACDLACFGCTQGCNLRGRPGMISVDDFERACKSLSGYFGVVGMFGGNPALHPDFVTLCEIMRRHVPPAQRGLWCNNPRGHGEVMRQTFNPAVSNLNVHCNATAYAEFKRDWPESRPFGLDADSRHSPPYVALCDVISDYDERVRLIEDCDINKYWSAMICVTRYGLRGYFCEIAGAQAMLHPEYPDIGVSITPGWWKADQDVFQPQIDFHCHRCGIPLKIEGPMALSGPSEMVSREHMGIYVTKRQDRDVTVIDDITSLGSVTRATDYLPEARPGCQ